MKNQKIFILLLIPLVVTVIIFSWFKEGKIISSTSEEELNIYHSKKFAELASGLWYPTGTGIKTPFFTVRYPVFFALGTLEEIGMQAFQRQALLLWVLMVSGVTGMYLLLRKIFNIPAGYSFIGSFFYLLNIFSMTQVWKRFLYHGIFAWAYLPLFILLWIKWINNKKIIWLFLFLLISVLFAYTFSQPAFIVTIWLPAGIFVLVRMWQLRTNTREVVVIFLRSVIGLLLWCLINIWWLYPMLTIGSTWTEQKGQSWQADLSSLHAVSKSFPLGELLLLRQSWYLSSENDFGSFYQNPFIIFMSIIIFVFVILAVIKVKKYSHKAFIIILACISLFISKGTSFPLGYTLFSFLFSTFSFSTAFRNSYEKFGIVWLLAYTILFTWGITWFLSSQNSQRRKRFGTIIVSLMLILVFPFWSGGVFPQKHRLDVPRYYDEANTYLNQQTTSRIFHVPFHLTLENSVYKWGFMGGDPSPALFELESITKPLTPFYSKIADLMPQFLGQKDFPKLLGMLEVESIVLHKDYIYPSIDIAETEKNIDGWLGIRDKKKIGQLIIYLVNKDLIRLRIYASTSIIRVTNLEDGLNAVISGRLDKNAVFILGNLPTLFALSEFGPDIEFKKLTNDHYRVNVKKAQGPYILILNNTFDKSWQAKIDNTIISEHFIANSFANGWIIQKTGDYYIDIRLKVWPWD